MKNIFDIDVSKGCYDGQMFCTKEVQLDTAEKLDDVCEEIVLAEEKTQLSWPVVIVEILCIIIVAGFINGIINAEVTIKQAFANAPYLFVIAPVAAIVLIVIFIRQKKMQKNMESHLEETGVLENLDEMSKQAAEELEIPEDSMRVDVLADVYEMKKGKKKPLDAPIILNPVMDMYIKGEFLCFTDATQEMGIAIEDIVQIENVKKRFSIAEWHKEEKYKSKKYKKYKIAENNYGLLIKGYYSIRINSIWGEFEIRLPNYEEEAIRKIEEITGKSVLG